MAVRTYMALVYGVFWLVRLNGCVRRGRQPRLRGDDWLFSVPVRPGFYLHEGRAIVRRFQMRMCIPFIVDPLTVYLLATGRLFLSTVLIIIQSGLIHLNHMLSVDRAEREARAFAVAEPPATRIAVSLSPRRLRDHTNWMIEWGLLVSSAAAFVWLARYYATPSHDAGLRAIFGLPVLMLYLQFGVLLLKYVMVAAPGPIPDGVRTDYANVRQETLRYYLRVCDWCRMTMVAMIVFWPVRLSTPLSSVDRLMDGWLLAWLLIGAIATVGIEIKRRYLTSLARRVRPVLMPTFQQTPPSWPVCYQPGAPFFVRNGTRGCSLNLGHWQACVGAAYCAGLVVLFVLLPVHH